MEAEAVDGRAVASLVEGLHDWGGCIKISYNILYSHIILF